MPGTDAAVAVHNALAHACLVETAWPASLSGKLRLAVAHGRGVCKVAAMSALMALVPDADAGLHS